jgi:hypothetical protein
MKQIVIYPFFYLQLDRSKTWCQGCRTFILRQNANREIIGPMDNYLISRSWIAKKITVWQLCSYFISRFLHPIAAEAAAAETAATEGVRMRASKNAACFPIWYKLELRAKIATKHVLDKIDIWPSWYAAEINGIFGLICCQLNLDKYTWSIQQVVWACVSVPYISCSSNFRLR